MVSPSHRVTGQEILLMDWSLGSCSPSRLWGREFTRHRKPLREGIFNLLLSLGMKFQATRGKASFLYKAGRCITSGKDETLDLRLVYYQKVPDFKKLFIYFYYRRYLEKTGQKKETSAPNGSIFLRLSWALPGAPRPALKRTLPGLNLIPGSAE